MKLRVMKGIIAFALCTSMVLSNINYIGASLSENATTDTNEITIDKNIDENTEGNTEENNGLITGGAAAVVDSSDTTTISENIVPLAPTITTSGNEIEEEEVITEDVVLETEVNGIKITLSGSSQAIPEGSKLQATELEPQTVETEIVEEALDQEEKEKKVKIQKYRAFDIKIMNGDSEIQPGENVKLAFSGDLLVPEGEEVIDVYHVNDADATVTSVKEEGGNDEVIAVTDSFSTYVLVIKTTIEGKTTVTSKYYLNHSNGSATQINRPTTTEIFLDEDDSGQFTITCDNGIDDVNGNQVYLLKEIVIKEDKVNGKTIKRIRNTEDNDIKVIEEKIDATNEKILVELYYDAVKGTFDDDVKFYDYDTSSIVEQEASITMWDYFSISKFTYNNATYNNYELRINNDGRSYQLRKSNNRINISNGTILTNVKIGNETYASCTFKANDWSPYLLTTKKTVITQDAGINSEAKEHKGAFLGMGKDLCSEPLYVAKTYNNRNLNANAFLGGFHGQPGCEKDDDYNAYKVAIVPGLIKGLSGTGYSTLDMGVNQAKQLIYEPGYFSEADNITGKHNYFEEFEVNFNQTGNRYQMTGVTYNDSRKYTSAEIDANNSEKINIRHDFFPLNDVPTARTQTSGGSTTNNEFYGMRYDFKFSLGDYIGPLTYKFQGDDDLWVFVDGKLVLDLGGIHGAYPDKYVQKLENNEVDLWAELFSISAKDREKDNWWEKIPEEEWGKERQVTILYMERGAVESSCYMDFVLPNVTGMDTVVTKIPKTPIQFEKVEAGNTSKKLAGAEFALLDSRKEVLQSKITSNAQGIVKFAGKFPEGTYYIKETKAPDGYLLNKNEWEVKVFLDTEGNIAYTINGMNQVDHTFQLENQPLIIDISKEAKLINWDARTYNLTLTATVNVTELAPEDAAKKVTIVDYLDPRFEFLNDSTDGTIGTDENGQYIKWETTLNELVAGIDAIGWTKTFPIIAKADYAGGNDVTTNGLNSGVTVEGGTIKEFVSPTVNVKAQFNIEDAKNVFFLGETIKDVYVTSEDFIKAFGADGSSLTQLSYQAADGKAYIYTDLQDVNVTVALNDQYANGLLNEAPKDKVVAYEKAIKATLVPTKNGAKSIEAMKYVGDLSKITDGKDENGNPLIQAGSTYYYAVPGTLEETADFKAYVVDGMLDITKQINDYYEKEGVSHHIIDNQTFIFKIERFEVNSDGTIGAKDSDFGNVYETISFKNGDEKSKTKVLIGLEKGYYKVTEETDWSWKYDNTTANISGKGIADYYLIGEYVSDTDRTLIGTEKAGSEDVYRAEFAGLDSSKRSFEEAGRYRKLFEDIDCSKDISNLVDITNVNNVSTNGTNPVCKAVFYFVNELNEKKKKIFGDVSVMTNDFK